LIQFVSRWFAVVVLGYLACGNAAAADNRMLGPNFPALVDTNGDGKPTEGEDLGIVPEVDGTKLVLDTPWDCNPEDGDDEFILDDEDEDGKFETATRDSDGSSQQQVTLDDFVNGRPTRGIFTEFGRTDRHGEGSVEDTDQDGIFDSFRLEDTTNDSAAAAAEGMSVLVSFVYEDVTGDGRPDYVSIPWSQAGLVGVRKDDDCGPEGGDPQIFVPLADSNGDGKPDSVVLDLDGDGEADAQFFKGPKLTTAVVCMGKPVTKLGTSGDDVIRGTAGSDVIHARAGNDRIRGLAGNDILCAGMGDDTIEGGKGRDHMHGGSGTDLLRGGSGRDTLNGGPGSDDVCEESTDVRSPECEL
jgi:hypothetical protein